MSPTITKGATTLTPEQVELEADVDLPFIKHTLVGGGTRYSLRSDEGRTGRMRLLFATRAEAFSAVELHLELGSFVYADDDNPEQSMTYVPRRVSPRTTRAVSGRWAVEVEFAEVI